MDPITRRVIEANTGVHDLRGLIQDIGRELYRQLTEWWRLTEDEAHDLFLELYPRIPALIQNFHYTGIGFMSFLGSCLKKRILKYRYRSSWAASLGRPQHVPYTENEEDEDDREGVSVVKVASDSHREGPDATTAVGLRFRPKLSFDHQRLHLLALRFSWYLDDSKLEQTAKAIGMDAAHLSAEVEHLRRQLVKKQERRRTLFERRAELLLRLYNIRALRKTCVAGKFAAKLERLEGYFQGCLRQLQRRIEAISLLPTYADIARVLGHRRNTVAGIFGRMLRSDSKHYALLN